LIAMPTQQQIERFTLAFHRVALQRLRGEPELWRQALAVLDRWEATSPSPSGRRYRDLWRQLLTGDLGWLEAAVCVDSEEAATLRGVSPLGFLLGESERLRIRHEAMAA
jgi:hypothetical protein